MIAELISRSRAAQKELASYSQEKLDDIARMFAKVVFDNAESLAQLAVDETQMGVYEDKVTKNRGKSRIIWNSIKNKRTVGIIEEVPEEGLSIVAKPIGVVAAVTPCTNPVVTPMCNAMFAVKCGNSIIVAPHPRGKKTAVRLQELYYPELKNMGVPTDIFLVIAEPTIELTGELISAADIAIATGGSGMVKAAYKSGKPALGVGPGNVQCIIDRNVDVAEAVRKVVAGRTFDNGIICASEQTVIVPREKLDEIIGEFVNCGAMYVNEPDALARLRTTVFPGGEISRAVVGQSAGKILSLAGIHFDVAPKLILIKPNAYGPGELFSKEKMCPLLCVCPYDSWEDAVSIAYTNLEFEGKGHSVSIHSNDEEHIRYAGTELPVSRIVINQISSTMAGGAFANGLNPTTTLGCGSWGNNSISENLSYFHLMNKSRIARVKPNWSQPGDDEIWS